MRGNLAVKIRDRMTERHVTRFVRDLKFTKVAPGGHHTASVRLQLPRGTFPDLGPADQMWVYDATTGRTIWEGYTENPGVTDGPAGEEYDIAAIGGMTLATDQSQPLIYVDRDLGQWQHHFATVPAYQAGAGSTPNVEDSALVFQFPRGIATTSNHRVTLEYPALKAAGLTFGAFYGQVKAGITDANYLLDFIASGGGEPTGTVGVTASTATVDLGPFAAGETGWAVGNNQARLRMIRSATAGATNITNDNTWFSVTNLWISMLRYNLDGTEVTGTSGYTGQITASEIVADLAGRGVIGSIDPQRSNIEATTHQITQFAHHDGVTAAAVLEDLTLYEPDHLWEVLESNRWGQHRLNYRAWPTTPRYEISTRDGFEAPGGEVDLCNRIAVYWTDSKGVKQTTVVTSYVPQLGNAAPGDPSFVGRIRDADPVTLPDGLGSTADAERIGELALAAKNDPPTAARATVRRPVMDRLTGTLVMPWDIEPGYVVRVRETGENLRLTEMEYDDNECSALLTLNEPTRTLDQQLAQIGGGR